MKNLLFIFGLLLAPPFYCFDTLVLTSKIASVQVTNIGTKVSNRIPIQAQQGNYVLHIKGLPSTVNKELIEFSTVEGIYVLHVDVVKAMPAQGASNGPHRHFERKVDSVYAQLKVLEKEEKLLLEEKKLAHEKGLNLDERERLQSYLHTRRNAIKRERQVLFKHLINLRENNSNKLRQIGQALPKFQQSTRTLFVSIAIIDETIKTIQWSYLLPTKDHSKLKSRQEWAPVNSFNSNETIELPPSVYMQGKVIEQEHFAPMVFATLELFQNGKLVQTSSTDGNGEFNLKLNTKTTYDLVISFEGYKKKKIKNIYIDRASVPHQMIAMKVKEKVSMLEIVAYTLPLLDLARGFVK